LKKQVRLLLGLLVFGNVAAFLSLAWLEKLPNEKHLAPEVSLP
jgi:hypothetical protein